MDWQDAIFTLIDMRSFSNLWFWIALAVMWSSASHYILGVPFDMVVRARRDGGQANEDLYDIVRIHVNRILYIARVAGLWGLGIACFVLTICGFLGFMYRIEFAQAIFLLALPMSIVGLVNISTARLIEEQDPRDEALFRRLARHRTYVQIIGLISIFVTAVWGMYQNLSVEPWGGGLGG